MNNHLKIFENYRKDETLRNQFHEFISVVFPGIGFVEWYSKGFWTDAYITFSILESGKIVSNVGVTFMEILLNGERCRAVQLGAVGTLPACRNRGLSRRLMKHVIKKFQNQADLFFLFANETVLDFYPKFGFKEVKEYLFTSKSGLSKSEYSARKLNIESEDDYLLLQDLLNSRSDLTRIFGARDYTFITMWHVLNHYRDDLYYLENEKAIVIKKEQDNTLHLLDVIFREPFDLQSSLSGIIESNSIKHIKYYFPPDQLSFRYDKVFDDHTGLFILGNTGPPAIPFRFPLTAIT